MRGKAVARRAPHASRHEVFTEMTSAPPIFDQISVADAVEQGRRPHVPVGISLYQGEFSFPWPTISAALSIALLPVCIRIALFQESVVCGLTNGAMKG